MDPAAIAELKTLLPGAFLGLTFVLLGFSAVLGSLMIWRRRELSLLFFGVFTICYGSRVLLQAVPAAQLFGWPGAWLAYLDSGLRLALLPLFSLFLQEILGPGRRDSFRWFWLVAAAFAALALVFELVAGRPGAGLGPGLVLWVLGLVLVIIHFRQPGFRPSGEQRGILAVYVLGTTAAVDSFLVNQELVPWTYKVEYPGALVVLLLIGFLLAHRILANRSNLLALNHELELARRIQQSILPGDPPRLAGVELAVHYRSMGEVAGDYYDFRQFEPARLGVLVADVSGHGIPAALIASMTKVAFAGQGQHLADPARLLEGLNESFFGGLDGQYLTASYFVLDRRDLNLTFAGAAHPPLLIRRAESGTVESLESSGTLVGLFPEVNARNRTIALAVGDRIIAYTDGFTEAANPRDELFGQERLERFLSENQALAAGDFADRLVALLSDWRQAAATAEPFDDDLTLIVVDILAEEPSQQPG